MNTRLRRGVLGTVTAVVSASSFVLLALPAQAVTPPAWPSAGRIPVGCSGTAVAAGATPGELLTTFTDTLTPTVSGWNINGSTSTVIMPVGGTTLKLNVLASESCTGVALAAPIVSLHLLAGSVATSFSATPSTTNAFNQKFTAVLPTVPITYAGRYQMPVAVVQHRYDTVVLDQDFLYKSSTAGTGSQYVTGPWGKQSVYVLLKTTATATASKASVAKGGSVTFKATVKKADAVAYVPANGAKVIFQTKSPGDTWVTRSTLTANATGVVSTVFKPSRTMQWRFVHAGDKTLRYTAPVSTAPKTIKVT